MNKYGKITEPGTIRFERLLPGTIEEIWAYLTESEKRGKWLAPGNMELRIGGKVELRFMHENLSRCKDPIPEKYKHYEKGDSMYGRITKYDPPRLLAYTWSGEPGESSEVTFELAARDEKVLLTLTHRHLGENKDTLISVGSGWHTHLGILKDHLTGDEPEGFWSVHSAVEKEYTKIVSHL